MTSQHDSVMSRRHPVMSRRHPVMSRRHPVMSRRRPVMSRRRPVMSRRRPVMSRRRPVMSRRRPVMSRRRPVMSRRDSVILPAEKSVSHFDSRPHLCDGSESVELSSERAGRARANRGTPHREFASPLRDSHVNETGRGKAFGAFDEGVWSLCIPLDIDRLPSCGRVRRQLRCRVLGRRRRAYANSGRRDGRRQRNDRRGSWSVGVE